MRSRYHSRRVRRADDSPFNHQHVMQNTVLRRGIVVALVIQTIQACVFNGCACRVIFGLSHRFVMPRKANRDDRLVAVTAIVAALCLDEVR